MTARIKRGTPVLGPSPELLEQAIKLAVTAHHGQRDKQGLPSILHVLRVMGAGRTLAEKVVGALHDIIEDTWVDAVHLQVEGYPTIIVDAVVALTRREKETYESYVRRAKRNTLATAVKCHDLRDNITRGHAFPSLISRYAKALTILEADATS